MQATYTIPSVVIVRECLHSRRTGLDRSVSDHVRTGDKSPLRSRLLYVHEFSATVTLESCDIRLCHRNVLADVLVVALFAVGAFESHLIRTESTTGIPDSESLDFEVKLAFDGSHSFGAERFACSWIYDH